MPTKLGLIQSVNLLWCFFTEILFEILTKILGRVILVNNIFNHCAPGLLDMRLQKLNVGGNYRGRSLQHLADIGIVSCQLRQQFVA